MQKKYLTCQFFIPFNNQSRYRNPQGKETDQERKTEYWNTVLSLSVS